MRQKRRVDVFDDEQEVRIIGPIPSANDEYDDDEDDEDDEDEDEGPEPITSLDELAERIKRIHELIPGAMFSFIEPCDLCGLNKWDQATHNVYGACRYLPVRNAAGETHLARLEYEKFLTITYRQENAE